MVWISTTNVCVVLWVIKVRHVSSQGTLYEDDGIEIKLLVLEFRFKESHVGLITSTFKAINMT